MIQQLQHDAFEAAAWPCIDMAPPPRTWRQIIHQYAQTHGLTFAELTGPSRCLAIAHPRQELFSILYSQRKPNGERRWSLPQIGRMFSGRDHTTVLHGIRRHEGRMRGAAGG